MDDVASPLTSTHPHLPWRLQGNSYWYNSTTGVSQYENPFETLSGKEAAAEADYGGEGEGGDYPYDAAGGEGYEGGEQYAEGGY